MLVTESTTEAFNILLPLLGAIVTDAGGLLSHSAIVAREYGIPGVVGTRDATDLHPRRRARPRRRRRGRSARLRVGCAEVVPLADAHEDALFGAKAIGLGRGRARGLADPARHRALGRDRRRGRRGRRRRDRRRCCEAARSSRRRWRCVRRPSTRTAPTRASPASTSRCSTCRRSTTCRGGPRDLVVGELRLRDHLPQARRPVHPPERRRRRAVAARPRQSPA